MYFVMCAMSIKGAAPFIKLLKGRIVYCTVPSVIHIERNAYNCYSARCIGKSTAAHSLAS